MVPPYAQPASPDISPRSDEPRSRSSRSSPDFAIGEGQWADFGVVANEIQVKFKVLASGGK